MSEWEAIVGSSRTSSYGSCIRSDKPSTSQYVKHQLEESDTLQGIALKYGSSTDELRRINKLYSSDSIFLRKFLLVPAPNICSASDIENGVMVEESVPAAKEEVSKDIDALSFLKQLDSQIVARKNAVKSYKFDESTFKTPNAESSAKYFKTEDYLKTHPKTIFSHSKTADSDQLFQL